jgi:thioredoxin 1
MDYNELIHSKPEVFVEFFASWCPHCQRMMPIIAKLKDELAGRVPVYQFDVDLNQQAALNESISSYPTYIIYRNGMEVWRYEGETSLEYLLAEVATPH